MRFGALTGLAAGLVAIAAALAVESWIAPARAGAKAGQARRGTERLVPEDASGPLRTVAIQYAPSADPAALPVWRQLFAVLPGDISVEVLVASDADAQRFAAHLVEWRTPHADRFHPVVVGRKITTWSRDRFAALENADGRADGIFAPPAVGAPFADRGGGDFVSPFALAHALYGREPTVSPFVFEGGDLAASRGHLFVDVNLTARNLGRADASRTALQGALAARFGQDVVWLGDEPGDVPRHHIMMYMVPLDEHTVAVGDPREGAALLAHEPAGADMPVDPDLDTQVRRFDHAADLLAARGFHVVRFPVIVLAGGGSYVTYTNALFDVDRAPGAARVVYLPTYGLPALDDVAAVRYQQLGYTVHRIDMSTIYRRNGSLGCLVNVVARG